MPINHRMKIIFIHIPKTGGQSIEKALNCYELYSKERAHYSAAKVKEIVSDAEFRHYFKFSIVRNPFDRVVSSYRYQVRGNNFRLVDCDKNSSFKEFILKLETKFKSFGACAWIDKNHYIPQYKFLYEGTTLLVDKVFRFEDFDTEIADLVEKLTGNSVPHVNRSGLATNYRDYFDSETRSIVENFYQEDLKVFSYDY